MHGLMQDWSMTLDKIIDHARVNFPRHEVVTRSAEGPVTRSTYDQVWRRAKQASHYLKDKGFVIGDRVATMAMNNDRHLETWYGAIGVGAVLHTLNPRLFPQQIAWIINHAGDRALFFDPAFAPLVEQIAPLVKPILYYVALTDGAHLPKANIPNLVAYEDVIAGRPLDTAWGEFDERTAAGLCYTSGTTGDPKGVLYSHRSNMLHALAVNQNDCFGTGAADVVMPVVPMFHANAWATTYVAPMCGAKLVMPGAKLDGASLFELLETEKVTFTAAVPTLWNDLLAYLRKTGQRLSTLKRVAIGGAAVPEVTLRGFEDEYGVEVVHAWGMTEMSPIGTLGKLLPEQIAADRDTQVRTKLKQGRSLFTVEMKIVDDAGAELPRDGKASGRLLVRGPAVSKAYFRHEGARNERGDALEPDGFFDTGDVATIDAFGYMQITDRAKDVIKSGGEWISSIEVENVAAGAAGVARAAVIGVAHPKWSERPLLIVEAQDKANPPPKAAMLAHLDGKIPKWWMPDDVVFVDVIPLGATGKMDKKVLREQFRDYALSSAAAE